MIRLTKIFIFLIFSMFLFYMVEQNVMLHQQTHQYCMQNPLNDPIDCDNLITMDTEPTAEDAMISTELILQRYSIAHKITMAIKHRSLVSVISKHWEPPKQA
jgi:hypothetical protein